MEVADHRNADAELVERIDDFGNGGGGGIRVNRYTHQFRTGARQIHYLVDRRDDIRRIGVGHRLDHDRVSPTHLDPANIDRDRRAALHDSHNPPANHCNPMT